MKNNDTAGRPEAVAYIRTAITATPVAGQEARCRALAKQHKLTVRAIYTDVGVSGNQVDRPALGRLLTDVADRRARVIVADPSRLGRKATVLAEVRRRIQIAGVIVVDGTPGPQDFLERAEMVICRYAEEQRRRSIRTGFRYRRSLRQASDTERTP
jgi:DNA invertase Pin-like site-specific DNA recombinase